LHAREKHGRFVEERRNAMPDPLCQLIKLYESALRNIRGRRRKGLSKESDAALEDAFKRALRQARLKKAEQ